MYGGGPNCSGKGAWVSMFSTPCPTKTSVAGVAMPSQSAKLGGTSRSASSPIESSARESLTTEESRVGKSSRTKVPINWVTTAPAESVTPQ